MFFLPQTSVFQAACDEEAEICERAFIIQLLGSNNSVSIRDLLSFSFLSMGVIVADFSYCCYCFVDFTRSYALCSQQLLTMFSHLESTAVFF